jgi:hypothetical protein
MWLIGIIGGIFQGDFWIIKNSMVKNWIKLFSYDLHRLIECLKLEIFRDFFLENMANVTIYIIWVPLCVTPLRSFIVLYAKSAELAKKERLQFILAQVFSYSIPG